MDFDQDDKYRTQRYKRDELPASMNLYLNAELADVHFIFKNGDYVEKVPANKVQLAAASPVFKTMFFGPMKEPDEVEIADASVEAFRNVKPTIENMKEVFYLVEKYDMLPSELNFIHVASESVIRKSSDFELWRFQMDNYIKLDFLREHSQSFTYVPGDLLSSDSFKRLDSETLKLFLELDIFEDTDEMIIIYAILVWAEYRCQLCGEDENGTNLKKHLGDILKSIRYNRITTEEFCMLASSNAGLFSLEEFQDIVFMMNLKEYEPRIFHRIPRWKSIESLQCDLKQNFDKEQLIHNPDTIFFSSNQPLLLKEIDTGNFPSDYLPKINDIDLTITEINTSNQMKKELYRGIHRTDSATGGLLILPIPVVIKPKFQYEIQLRLSIDQKFESEPAVKWEKYSIELADDIQVELQQNSLKFDWFENLHFNKL